MTVSAAEQSNTTSFDVYGNTDRLDDPILDVMATRLEARYARPEFQRMMVDYLEAMQIDQADTVLDLGCGTGVAARYIASRPNFTGSVTAVDISSHLLETGRLLASEEGLDSRITFRQGDSRRLDLPDDSFDAVVAHTLISHVDELAAALEEIARVAKPGAFIGIFDGDYASLTFSNPDPHQGKVYDELLVSGLITNPRVMRQLPALLTTVDLDLVQHFGYIISDVGRSDFSTEIPYDLIMAFDAIHDLASPDAVLKHIRKALAPGGAFLMVEFKFSSLVDENIGNPFAPMYYGFSLLHCTPVALAAGGPGLGAVWGEQTAKQMLAEAGFTEVTVLDTPRPQNYMFLCRS